jgi:hypothetical protein
MNDCMKIYRFWKISLTTVKQFSTDANWRPTSKVMVRWFEMTKERRVMIRTLNVNDAMKLLKYLNFFNFCTHEWIPKGLVAS